MTTAADYNTLLTAVASAVSDANTVIADVAAQLATETDAEEFTTIERDILAHARLQAQKVLDLQAVLLDHTHEQLTSFSL